MSSIHSILLFSLFCLLSTFSIAINPPPFFTDVTGAAGIDTSGGKQRKYGGPAIADLDRDGYPDMIWCHHDQANEELYFNNRDGTFSKAFWYIREDTHGISPYPVSPFSKNIRFSVSVGGNFGKNPRPPYLYEVTPQRKITNIGAATGINGAGGRGRTAIYLDLSNGLHPQWLDVIYTSARPTNPNGVSNFAFENVNGNNFRGRTIRGSYYAFSDNGQAMVTDHNNDGRMEVLAFWRLTMYKVTNYFTLTDISNQVFPAGLNRQGCIAIAELDYDNDGDFDLYVARFRIGSWLPAVAYNDYLLENRNGKYVEVSSQVGLPKGTQSHGVTVGDFNNDGWIDIHVTQYNAPDYILVNNGNRSFRRVAATTWRPPSVSGDNAAAVDYDLDGRLDLIAAQGNHINIGLGGTYRIFKNVINIATGRANFLNVRVGNAPNGSSTPMNAVITVVAGGVTMKRRVGSPGTEFANSYIETQHFGLGGATFAQTVSVRYPNGQVTALGNVRAGQTVVVGIL